jgi:hypothetical protein
MSKEDEIVLLREYVIGYRKLYYRDRQRAIARWMALEKVRELTDRYANVPAGELLAILDAENP